MRPSQPVAAREYLGNRKGFLEEGMASWHPRGNWIYLDESGERVF